MTPTTTQTTAKNNNPWPLFDLSGAMKAASLTALSIVGIEGQGAGLDSFAKNLEDGFNNLTNPNSDALVVKNDTENGSSKILATLISGAQKIIPSRQSLDPLLEKATEMTESASAGIGQMTEKASAGIGQMTTEASAGIGKMTESASAGVAEIINYFEGLGKSNQTNITEKQVQAPQVKSARANPSAPRKKKPEITKEEPQVKTDAQEPKKSSSFMKRVSSLRGMFSSKSDESSESSEKSNSGFLKRAFSFASSNSNSTSAPTRDAPSVASSSDKKNLARASSVTSETSTVLSRSRSWGSYFSSKGPLADAPKASDSPPRASYLQRTRTFISETKESTSNFIKEKKGSFREWRDERNARLEEKRAEREAKEAEELMKWRHKLWKKDWDKYVKDNIKKAEEAAKPENKRKATIEHIKAIKNPFEKRDKLLLHPYIDPTEVMSTSELIQHGLTRVVRTVTPPSPTFNYQYKENDHVELEGTITGSSFTSALTTIGRGLAGGARSLRSGLGTIARDVASVASEARNGSGVSTSYRDATRTFGIETGVTPLTAQEFAGGAVNFLSDKSSGSTVGIGTVIAGAGRELGAGLRQMTPSTNPKLPKLSGRLTVWMTTRS